MKIPVIVLCAFSAALWAQVPNDEPPVMLLPSRGNSGTGEQLLGSAQQGVVAPTNTPAPAQTMVLPQGTISTAPLSANTQAPPPWSGYQAAESLAANGNPELALKQLEARLVSAPDDAKAAYLKGLILMQLGRAEDAERWFKMMNSNFPTLPQPYNALAVIYSGRNDWTSAQKVLEQLLSIDPKHHNARLNLANVHLRLAREQYEAALNNKPNDAMIMQKLQQLDALQK